MILMLIKKKKYKSKNENSHRTLVKNKAPSQSNEIKEINDLIRRVSKARANDFVDMANEINSIPSFTDRFDTKTEKEYINK
jgi:hypothetical protein